MAEAGVCFFLEEDCGGQLLGVADEYDMGQVVAEGDEGGEFGGLCGLVDEEGGEGGGRGLMRGGRGLHRTVWRTLCAPR